MLTPAQADYISTAILWSLVAFVVIYGVVDLYRRVKNPRRD